MLALIDADWKDVVGYEGLYQVSNTGLLYSLPRHSTFKSTRYPKGIKRLIKGCLIATHVNKLGYVQGCLYREGKLKLCLLHRLVAQAFIPNPEGKATVNHINEIKDDNHVENLEWCTQAENVAHSLYKSMGEASSSTTLTNANVLEIKNHLEEGIFNQTELGALYNVSNHVIHKIKVGKNWGWLTGLNQEDK